MITGQGKAEYSILDLGYNKLVVLESSYPGMPVTTPEMTNLITSGTTPGSILSGELYGNTTVTGGYIQSDNFKTGVSGWRLTSTSAELNISTAILSLDIPDTTTANSFHVDSVGNTWWGVNLAIGYATAPAYVLNTGAAKFTNVIITGGTIGAGIVVAAGSDTQIQFNDGGVLGADDGLTFNKTTKILSVINSSNASTFIINPYDGGGIDIHGDKPLEISSDTQIDIFTTTSSGGGGINIYTANYNAGNVQTLSIYGGNSTGGNGTGGDATFDAGNGNGTGTGGEIEIGSGSGGSTGSGGAMTIDTGNAGFSGNGHGGILTIVTGDGYGTGVGGDIFIVCGNGQGTGRGADLYLVAGRNNGAGTNGRFVFRPKNGVSTKDGILNFDNMATTNKTFTFQNFTSIITGQAAALTSTRVPFSDSNGLLTDSANMTFSSDTLTVTGLVIGTTKLASYNGIPTVSGGIPSEVATIDSPGLTANVGASTLYSVPSSGEGMYRVNVYVVETTAGSLSSTLPNVQIVFTDKDSNVSVTMDATPILGVAGIGQTGALNANTIGTASSGVIVIYVKASTTIQYQTVNYASSLAGMAYALRIKLEAL